MRIIVTNGFSQKLLKKPGLIGRVSYQPISRVEALELLSKATQVYNDDMERWPFEVFGINYKPLVNKHYADIGDSILVTNDISRTLLLLKVL